MVGFVCWWWRVIAGLNCFLLAISELLLLRGFHPSIQKNIINLIKILAFSIEAWNKGSPKILVLIAIAIGHWGLATTAAAWRSTDSVRCAHTRYIAHLLLWLHVVIGRANPRLNGLLLAVHAILEQFEIASGHL